MHIFRRFTWMLLVLGLIPAVNAQRPQPPPRPAPPPRVVPPPAPKIAPAWTQRIGPAWSKPIAPAWVNEKGKAENEKARNQRLPPPPPGRRVIYIQPGHIEYNDPPALPPNTQPPQPPAPIEWRR